MSIDEPPSTAMPVQYFVDESGDGVLFDAKGRVLYEAGSAPRHFILGMARIEQPEQVAQALTELRMALLADPYFKGVPSFRPDAGKTALYFHAKDDLPEVRREVLRLLLTLDFKFSAVVKSMKAVLDYVRRRNLMDSRYRYRPNELYDLTVRMLFKQRLHQHRVYRIVFARRGKRDRTEALKEQIQLARERFLRQLGREADETALEVIPAYPQESPGLQVADYCLWALQRLFEKEEDRYVQMLWPKVSLIHDVDDNGRNRYGCYYSKRRPLTIADIKNRQV
ncbi:MULTISPECIES: DUF3800 domain-containing protein [Thiorhodovibrio]|uniref:DUF3800 domain-containing protein n=1 Tax=Thiorhodovibrio TaxID=61593 RepID=UPI001914AE6C|nr:MULTISPECIES: DUF3800 domain-containing protein [Thiorhodovibrio]MBK5968480.1 hypothetical protein [Thiorhodovibrio winogradskyi]WPL11125.1 hypothetical protein Thiosp_00853 [Thiorhodovibrio litoralis]